MFYYWPKYRKPRPREVLAGHICRVVDAVLCAGYGTVVYPRNALKYPVCKERHLKHVISAVLTAPELCINFRAAQVGVVGVAANR